jgi:1-acyl-sn-glycerol-3-phosphate acyltransferase
VLWAALPGEVRELVRPVAAQDYWEKAGLRSYLSQRVFHAILINRNPQSSDRTLVAAQAVIDKLLAAMGDRYSLIVFPEGTRGSGDDVAPFTGAFRAHGAECDRRDARARARNEERARRHPERNR